MLEPDVTLTDLILAVQSLSFIFFLRQKPHSKPWVLFFGMLSAASLLGAAVHGYVPDKTSFAFAVLWRMTLFFVGGIAFGAWLVGSEFLSDRKLAAQIKTSAYLQYAIFCGVIMFYSQKFLVAAINYLPSACFLLLIFVHGFLSTRKKTYAYGIMGVVLIFLGSFVQIAKISLHPIYFNHNALYHMIQFIAVWLLFLVARWKLSKPST